MQRGGYTHGSYAFVRTFNLLSRRLEPGANVDDEAALDEKMFALVVDCSESWPLHQDMAMGGMFQMSLSGMMNALNQSYEEDYYSDMEFSDEDEEDDQDDGGDNE